MWKTAKTKAAKNTTHHQNWYSLFAHLMWDAGLHLQIIIDTAPWLIHILSPCLSDESTGSAWPDWMRCTTLVDRPNPSIGYLDLYAFGSSFIFVFNYFCSTYFLTFKRACWIQIMEFDGPGARIHTICINFKYIFIYFMWDIKCLRNNYDAFDSLKKSWGAHYFKFNAYKIAWFHAIHKGVFFSFSVSISVFFFLTYCRSMSIAFSSV